MIYNPYGGDREGYSETHSTGLRAADVIAPEPVKRIPASVELVPYQGWVRANSICAIDGVRRKVGEVFEISVPALWTDDPFVPVEQVQRPFAGWPNEPTHTQLDLQHLDAALRPSNASDGLL